MTIHNKQFIFIMFIIYYWLQDENIWVNKKNCWEISKLCYEKMNQIHFTLASTLKTFTRRHFAFSATELPTGSLHPTTSRPPGCLPCVCWLRDNKNHGCVSFPALWPSERLPPTMSLFHVMIWKDGGWCVFGGGVVSSGFQNIRGGVMKRPWRMSRARL